MAKKKADYIRELLDLYIRNDYSEDLEKKVQDWLADERLAEEKEEALREYWNSLPTLESKYSETLWAELSDRLGFPEKPVRKAPLGRRLAFRIAAVVVPLLAVAGVLTMVLREKPDAEIIRVAVTDGLQKQVTLPDGSTVWINANSSVEYPEQFGRERTVKLSGEVYFKVVPDPKRPFIAGSERIEVKVLGTEFNINDYADGEATVTLASGSIEVKTAEKTIRMAPGEQMTYRYGDNELRVTEQVPEEEYDWRGIKLNFIRMPLEQIAASIRTYYGIRIDNRGVPVIPGEQLSFKLTGDESIEQVMYLLQHISELRFTYRIEGDTVILEPQEL